MSRWKKVQKGEPLLEFPADLYNALIDMAAWFQSQNHVGAAAQHAQRPFDQAQQTVLIYNDSGATVGAGDILGIDPNSYYDLTQSSERAKAFKNPVLVGKEPAFPEHIGSFGIVVDPISNGGVGRAVISGIAGVVLDVEDEGHLYADVTDEDDSKLTSREFGGAEILKKSATGTGDKFALVRVGTLHMPDIFGHLDADLEDGASAAMSVYKMQSDGSWVDTGRTATVWGNMIDADKELVQTSRVWARPIRTSGLLEVIQSRECPTDPN